MCKMDVLLSLVASIFFLCNVKAQDWDLDFDFSAYNNQLQLLITQCQDHDLKQQINEALCGNQYATKCIEIPTTNQDLPHVTCSADTRMGKVINLTLYKNDDDSLTGSIDRQRIEMKTFRSNPEMLTQVTDYVYAWWFHLNPNLKTGEKFFHIFQLKSGVDSTPLLTFSLTRKLGFHIRWRTENRTGVIQESKQIVMDLPDALGRWLQASVQIHYQNASSYFRVTIKDENGFELFPLNNASGIFNCNSCELLRETGHTIHPKWGFYRAHDDLHQPSDWQLFQNIQVWRDDDSNSAVGHYAALSLINFILFYLLICFQ